MTMQGGPILRRILDGLLLLVTLVAVGISFWKKAPDWVSLLVLTTFVVLFFIRCWYSDHRAQYLKHNWIDLALVVLLSSPLLRLFVVFKVAGLLPALKLGALIRSNKERLMKLVVLSNESFPVAMTLVFGVVFVFGTATYLLERQVNPAFADISDGLWWAFVTLTTVGYGDIVPATAGGRVVAVFTMVFGIMIYSLMIANLTYFVEQAGKARAAARLKAGGNASQSGEGKKADSSAPEDEPPPV
jgi:voltage-gated potassium channel